MIVLDASVLIAVLDSDDASHRRGVQLLRDAPMTPLCASVMTIAETLVAPSRAGRIERARTAIAELGIASIAISANDTESLALIRAETGMRMPDCCVLLAGERTGGSIATFDTRLATVAKQRGTVVIE